MCMRDIRILMLYTLIRFIQRLKKNILRSGNINSIRGLLDLENIKDRADELFDEFKKLDYKKIILKRPIKADQLDKNINYQVKGKSTRFDIYL